MVRSPWPAAASPSWYTTPYVSSRPVAASLVEGDEGVAEHVHARGERAGCAHGVEPVVERERPAHAGDGRVRMEERLERVDVAFVGRARVSLHQRAQLVARAHSTATGFTGHPVARSMRSGAMENRNSQRPAAAHCSPRRRSDMLSIKWRPIAVMPI